jgi:hypothetical protein
LVPANTGIGASICVQPKHFVYLEDTYEFEFAERAQAGEIERPMQRMDTE